MLERIVFGLGSNVGRRLFNIRRAIREICISGKYSFLAHSRIYETEPWGFKDQNKFINCVLVCLTKRKPLEVIEDMIKIEKKLGRKKREKWREREIDIDILFYGNKVIKTGSILIPHTMIQSRNFVLKPLMDLMPDFVHPSLGKSIRTLYEKSEDQCKVKVYKNGIIN